MNNECVLCEKSPQWWKVFCSLGDPLITHYSSLITHYQKKLQACKPDSVSHKMGPLSFICDDHCWPPVSAYPPNIGRAALRLWCIWHFSTQGLPESHLPVRDRELLPHIFTFAPFARGSYFLWHCLVPTFTSGVPPLAGCVALCCPDFPFPAKRKTIARPAARQK